MSSIFKISDADKKVGKTFSSLSDARTYILDNKLQSLHGRDRILITETKVHTVKIKKDKLSNSYRVLILKKLKSLVEEGSILADGEYGAFMYFQCSDSIRESPRNPIISSISMKVAELKLGSISESIEEHQNALLKHNYELKKSTLIELLKYLIEADIEKIQFIRTSTDFLNCNILYGICFEDIYIGARKNDIHFSTSEIIGRNVSCNKIIDLTDESPIIKEIQKSVCARHSYEVKHKDRIAVKVCRKCGHVK